MVTRFYFFYVTDLPDSNTFDVTRVFYYYSYDVTSLPDSKTFEVTLMICLIRNLTNVTQPYNGFDRLPLPEETTPGVDLARIKWNGNKLANDGGTYIYTDFFNTAWSDISDAVSRLGGQAMYQECQGLKVKVLDKSDQDIILLDIYQLLQIMKELIQTMDKSATKNSKVEYLTMLPGSLEIELSKYQSNCNIRADSIRTTDVKAKPTMFKDDVEINGYKGAKNEDEFYQLKIHVECDNFVVDCIIDNRLKQICRKSVCDLQEVKQMSETESSFNKKVEAKFLSFVETKNSCLCQYFLTHTSNNAIESHVLGAIPIGENHFPVELQGILTDVIEGFPRFCSNKLRIGDSVTNTRLKGSLGGFCRFYGREAFLTCAHTMMDWETLLSTGQKHHTQLESVHLSTGDKILNETLLCGKVVNHSFTHHNPQKISTDVAVVELDKNIFVSLDDYVNTKGNGSLHYTELDSYFLFDYVIPEVKDTATLVKMLPVKTHLDQFPELDKDRYDSIVKENEEKGSQEMKHLANCPRTGKAKRVK
ncbi:unnamed protein product [Mytilus coruscus]|uniref:DZIP3-like HEPN domain-containing protein n=1 Tax=Mytilus coruscus TaxID=42192 RepID=A0A6J8CJ38_MYTCO|nr:unnamed protein product [Mytilus coruscus]